MLEEKQETKKHSQSIQRYEVDEQQLGQRVTFCKTLLVSAPFDVFLKHLSDCV